MLITSIRSLQIPFRFRFKLHLGCNIPVTLKTAVTNATLIILPDNDADALTVPEADAADASAAVAAAAAAAPAAAPAAPADAPPTATG